MLSRRQVCSKRLQCGHDCPGFDGESTCAPCLVSGCATNTHGNQNREDDCVICYTEPLAAAPVVMLTCGHTFHFHCVKLILAKKWVGEMISFSFMRCPICKAQMNHPELETDLRLLNDLYDDVVRKGLVRLQFEGLSNCEEITTPGLPFYQKPAEFALQRYAYYSCFKCKKPYFGGIKQCVADDFEVNKTERELICAACSGAQREAVCKTHGTDYVEYKCRYCCSIAVYFCFGTTHFCNACHNQAGTMVDMKPLPSCPAGPCGKQLTGECPLGIKHSANGEEFIFGCGLCANLNTF